MRDWILSAIAVTPIAFLVGHLFDPNDWQMWAILAAALWWRVVIQYAAKPDSEDRKEGA